LKEEERRHIKTFGIVAGLLCVGAILSTFLSAIGNGVSGCGDSCSLPLTSTPTAGESDTHALGMLLFTKYTLPFEVISVLLLVAMIGVITLSKKDLK
jgi:NADH:ubiquinone oxidoreductase subunit 6 (subunit J)